MTNLKQSQGFIAGQWRDGHSGRTFKVLNPFNNEELENVADFDVNDVGVAIDDAHDTFKTWRKSTFKQRSALLKKIGDLMLENKEELGLILTSEQGKPLAEATGEVGFAASFFHFFSEECKRPEGSVISASAPGKQFITVREPLGVAAMVCPWNFPIGMPARKIAAAMAAGESISRFLSHSFIFVYSVYHCRLHLCCEARRGHASVHPRPGRHHP